MFDDPDTFAVEKLDAELREALVPVSGGSLFVYHPAFGYFLDRYDIEQVAIERPVVGKYTRSDKAAAIIDGRSG